MSAGTSSDIFRDDFLQFAVEKPRHWHFMPSAWSPVAQLQQSRDPGLEWAKHANLPFCCAMDQHESPLHAYSTLQVTARPFQVPDNELASHMLEQTLALMASHHVDFSLIEANSTSIIAGCRANAIRARYTLITRKEGEEQVEFSVLGRNHLVFAPGRAFSVGLSSSEDPAYFDEADFTAILESIRIRPS